MHPEAAHRAHSVVHCTNIVIRLAADGVTTVDYEEKEPGIEQTGFIGLQMHSHPGPIEVHFKDLRIKELR